MDPMTRKAQMISNELKRTQKTSSLNVNSVKLISNADSVTKKRNSLKNGSLVETDERYFG